MGRTLKLLKVLSWTEYVSEFITTKKVQSCRARTIRDYRIHITRFFQKYPDCLDDYHQLHHCVSEYFAVSDLAPATFNIRRLNLNSFFSYLVKEGVIPLNPINFPKRKDESKARNIYQEVLIELLRQPDKKPSPDFGTIALSF
jgi:site-specific recombinase XerD